MFNYVAFNLSYGYSTAKVHPYHFVFFKIIQLWKEKCSSQPLPQIEINEIYQKCTDMYNRFCETYPHPFVLFENTIWKAGVPLHSKCVKIGEIKFNEMYPKCTINFMKFNPFFP